MPPTFLPRVNLEAATLPSIRSFGMSLAWCFLVYFPFVIANGFLSEVRPYDDSYPDADHWNWMIYDLVVRKVIVIVLGSSIGFCVTSSSVRKGRTRGQHFRTSGRRLMCTGSKT
jgi:hypothetical protein